MLFVIYKLISFLGHTAQVCLLLKHKANQYLRDHDNIEPLEVATKQANANIVTLYVFLLPNTSYVVLVYIVFKTFSFLVKEP